MAKNVEKEHFIQVRSIQEHRGGFGIEQIGTDDQMILDMHKEKSLSFNCYCGKTFYKRENAEQHLKENE